MSPVEVTWVYLYPIKDQPCKVTDYFINIFIKIPLHRQAIIYIFSVIEKLEYNKLVW